jgi:hypothetical protein
MLKKRADLRRRGVERLARGALEPDRGIGMVYSESQAAFFARRLFGRVAQVSPYYFSLVMQY